MKNSRLEIFFKVSFSPVFWGVHTWPPAWPELTWKVWVYKEMTPGSNDECLEFWTWERERERTVYKASFATILHNCIIKCIRDRAAYISFSFRGLIVWSIGGLESTGELIGKLSLSECSGLIDWLRNCETKEGKPISQCSFTGLFWSRNNLADHGSTPGLNYRNGEERRKEGRCFKRQVIVTIIEMKLKDGKQQDRNKFWMIGCWYHQGGRLVIAWILIKRSYFNYLWGWKGKVSDWWRLGGWADETSPCSESSSWALIGQDPVCSVNAPIQEPTGSGLIHWGEALGKGRENMGQSPLLGKIYVATC